MTPPPTPLIVFRPARTAQLALLSDLRKLGKSADEQVSFWTSPAKRSDGGAFAPL
jgi:hypothetical protein